MNEFIHEQQAGELAMTLVDQAKGALDVRDDAGYAMAGKVLVSIKSGIKGIKKYWEDPVKRARAALDVLSERRSLMLEPLESAERDLKSRMVVYMEKTEQARQAAAFVARAALEAQAKAERDALIAEQEAFGDAAGAAETLAAPVSVPHVIFSGAPKVAGVAFREVWRAEVLDPMSVPREYLVVDEKKLDAVAKVLKADARVPGVRFYSEKIVVAGR